MSSPADSGMFPADDAVNADVAPASEAAEQPAPAPQGDDGGALREVLAAVNGLNQRIAAMEQRGNVAPAAPAGPREPNADFNELYANPGEFVAARAQAATKAALDQFAGQLTPFFETVAEGLAQRGIDTARTQFDSTIGSGAFDKLVASDLEIALSKIPPAQRANAAYVQAIAAGVLGGKMLSAEGQQEVKAVMAEARKRPAAPVLLSGNRGSPSPARLTDSERETVDRIRRSGVAFSEAQYLDSRNRERTEEAWGATWMNQPSAVKRPPNGKAGV